MPSRRYPYKLLPSQESSCPFADSTQCPIRKAILPECVWPIKDARRTQSAIVKSPSVGINKWVHLLPLTAGAALDPLGHRAVDVVAGDPALVVVLLGARGRASRLGARKGLDNLLLGLLGGLNTGLGEQSLD